MAERGNENTSFVGREMATGCRASGFSYVGVFTRRQGDAEGREHGGMWACLLSTQWSGRGLLETGLLGTTRPCPPRGREGPAVGTVQRPWAGKATVPGSDAAAAKEGTGGAVPERSQVAGAWQGQRSPWTAPVQGSAWLFFQRAPLTTHLTQGLFCDTKSSHKLHHGFSKTLSYKYIK